ncbi:MULTISPECIES: DUF1566 domain-containing protein [Shewanella]|uniref:Lcl C-terminal domain-containing protein n=1 Tax=Shewanella putrefaciens (strain CN-32 / ATCC BAA-453) TaxID=319224 RepID=A4YAJ5_SHEPC|nr:MULTISPECIES: DUF1566 domain-containing protein [Shewanella]ABM23526.1 protein of unknown function DUF1566 [Shewanella sp. W3-18-1]QGS48661.1 DUF1566 domain-containing protein [Shewanella putrefaciens]CAD6364800.1 hypothetical protein SHEWT2_03287 [Shewanella hafniensis]
MLNFNKLLLWIFLLIVEMQVYASELCSGIENSAIQATTPSSEFTDNGDGTVTHLTTGLIWQRCSLGQTWDGSYCIDNATTYNWPASALQAKDNLFAGYSDWRLPNKNELASIIEYRCHHPAINSQIFPNTSPSGYWSSSHSSNYGNHTSWIVEFNSGSVYLDVRFHYYHVRLVRGG